MLTSSKHLQIDHLIHMSDEAAPLPTFEDLADTACDLLDCCRRRGLAVGPETKLIEIALEAQNCTRLEKLIGRVNAKPQDGSLGTSSASQGSAASGAIALHHDSIFEPDTSSMTSSVAEPHNAAIPAPYPAIRTTPEHYAVHASLATCRHILWNERTRGVQNQDHTFWWPWLMYHHLVQIPYHHLVRILMYHHLVQIPHHHLVQIPVVIASIPLYDNLPSTI